jgi:hypothetical protein
MNNNNCNKTIENGYVHFRTYFAASDTPELNDLFDNSVNTVLRAFEDSRKSNCSSISEYVDKQNQFYKDKYEKANKDIVDFIISHEDSIQGYPMTIFFNTEKKLYGTIPYVTEDIDKKRVINEAIKKNIFKDSKNIVVMSVSYVPHSINFEQALYICVVSTKVYNSYTKKFID